jgi:DNA ligase-1
MIKLYKLDTKGKLRVWQAVAMDGEIIEKSGLVDGKLVENRKMAKPKNVGKVNATTAQEQATAEIESKVTKKLREGYFKTIEEAETTVVILPMLAKTFGDHEHKITYPCYVQPKLDGMRCLGNSAEMMSRKATPIGTMGHIQEELTKLGLPYTLDGELYAHGLTFQENMKLIKKYREPVIPDEAWDPNTPKAKESLLFKNASSVNVKYHIYDIVAPMPFDDRSTVRGSFNYGEYKYLEPVPTYEIADEAGLHAAHAKFLAQGYEGTMVRWGDEPYKVNGRSENLLKYKDFKDMAAEIVDVIPMDARPDQGLMVCKCNAGEFKATPKMSVIEKRQILIDKADYIGKTAEIRYFEETDKGLPRFPVYVGLRLDK